MGVIDIKTGVAARWHKLQVAAYSHMDTEIELEFEPEAHVYKYDGRVIPSVTQILSALGAIPDYSTSSEWRRDAGTAVHMACALLPDRLDWSSVDWRIMPYVMSYNRWLDTVEVVEQEKRGYNKQMRYAGTLDVRVWGSQTGTLYLQADGTMPKFIKQSDVADWQVFVSMVNVYHWIRNGRE